MTVYGSYGFDGFLKTGAENLDEMERYIKKSMLKGMPIDIDSLDAGCSSFIARNEKGEVLFGRNFDYSYAPSVVVHTNPRNGFASLSVSDLAFAGYRRSTVPQKNGITKESFFMLAAPYVTEDGMNEKGVAMSILTTPTADAPRIDGAPTLNTLTMVRMVFDKASSVDEAVEMMKKYNINWYDTNCHFFIADASGKSVVVEYYDGELHAIETRAVTNFDIHNNGKTGGTGFDRYNTIEQTLDENDGILSEEQAVDLLSRSVVRGRNQWMSLYNLTTGEVYVAPNGNKENVKQFKLDVTD